MNAKGLQILAVPPAGHIAEVSRGLDTGVVFGGTARERVLRQNGGAAGCSAFRPVKVAGDKMALSLQVRDGRDMYSRLRVHD